MKPCHPAAHVEACSLCRLYAANAAYRASIDSPRTPRTVSAGPAATDARTVPSAPVVARPDRCDSFTGRAELRHGCSGWTCRGGCTLGRAAVPGVFCQTCDAYVPDPDYQGLGTAGWLR